MVQMTFEGILSLYSPQSETTRTLKAPVAASIETGSIDDNRTDLVDVSDTAHDAGIKHKMAVTIELYERLQRCYPNDPYENEVVLWEVLWLAGFEHILNAPIPVFAFIAAIPCAGSEDENARLRYTAGDPAILEIIG